MTRPAAVDPSTYNRSRVSNGKDVLPGIDGRSVGARRYRDIVADLTAELGVSGAAAELQIRAAASLQMQAETLTAAMARGEAVDQEQLSRAANGAVRALSALRKRPQAKAKGSPLAEYLSRRKETSA